MKARNRKVRNFCMVNGLKIVRYDSPMKLIKVEGM